MAPRSPDRTRRAPIAALMVASALLAVALTRASAQPLPVVPKDQRGGFDSERSGTHDAANIRTLFWNFGMVGDYPPDPGNVDLSVFHSVEVPKGTGMNYSDGITPFVLAKVRNAFGDSTYIMETGFRERQALSPFSNRIMRFEPRPGYFKANPDTNRARSPAISHDPRTWPSRWPDKLADPDDYGWAGSWDGYFGKRPAADQESYTVMDDDYYDAFAYFPDSRDSTRQGLGLRVGVRGFQWSNPQAGNVIFWHYDITNESTTDYDDNIIFGLYMDSGVGGSPLSCDGIFESDDDNAFFDKSLGLNLVYTWDRFGHGVDLSGLCGRTGYLGYAYLETPGNASNGLDDDGDGFVDEQRDGGPGLQIVGQSQIIAYWAAHYDTTKFTAFYGPIADRPAYRFGSWWTGDEDMDWRADFNDLGADGVPDTHDTGEGDGIPTEGEANFDRTDVNESDQIGLTGFKMNRIRAGSGNPDPTTDGILFYTDDQNWPGRLYGKFSNPNPAARFDSALAANYNIGFLFASGPFFLKAGKTERFSLALAYGADLTELRETVHTVQLIYNANYQFAVPPPAPTVTAEAGDGRVRLSWTDNSERAFDPVTNEFDFEGYRIYRSTDPDFLDVKVVTDGRGTNYIGNGKPIAQFDLDDGKRGYSRKTINGVAYWLGEETGITHTWTDATVTNGQQYYYAVCAYDFGRASDLDSLAIYPSENSIPVSRTPRGGLILPVNVAAARPNARVPGYAGAAVSPATHAAGTGTGTVDVRVVNSDLVLVQDSLYTITFTNESPDSLRATAYTLRDSTNHRTVFTTGHDFEAKGVGATGDGLMPLVFTHPSVTVDQDSSGYTRTSPTTTRDKVTYNYSLSRNERRPGFPDDIRIEFDNVVRDTGLKIGSVQATPGKFRIFAETDTGDLQLDFRFRDIDGDRTLSALQERIDVVTYSNGGPTVPSVTWTVELDTLGQGARGPIVPPSIGDTLRLQLTRPLNVTDRFVFTTTSAKVGAAAAAGGGFTENPYVVPNPYIGAASFEPARFAVSGRGERRVEFRAIPQGSTIRIYTVRGELVQTLRQDGSTNGYVAWNLRTKDNLDVAPGLYVFQVEAPGVGVHIGKLAVIK